MEARSSEGGGLRSRSNTKILAAIVVLLVVSCPILLIVGSSLAQYDVVQGQPLTYFSGSILPSPDVAIYKNVSLKPGTTINEEVGISYNTTYDHPTFIYNGDLLILAPKPAYDPSYGQELYVFFGFIFVQKVGTINWTFYGPNNSLIDRERVGNSTLESAYYLQEANGIGTYQLMVTNVGLSDHNLTIAFGYSITSWSKPYFYQGVLALVLGIIGTASLPILGMRYGSETRIRETRKEREESKSEVKS